MYICTSMTCYYAGSICISVSQFFLIAKVHYFFQLLRNSDGSTADVVARNLETEFAEEKGTAHHRDDSTSTPTGEDPLPEETTPTADTEEGGRTRSQTPEVRLKD